ncbi:MAG: penicillin-insensitive murein endopeptidase [Nannocystis sp.]|nr:penicillin-insensitive murein endopeptidase [Nannocystis sp.]
MWGSSHTIRALHAAIADFRHQSGFAGEIVIGSMSLRRGGRFAPHRSHQSGRDVDIRLPLLPALPLTAFPNADEIDWPAAWELVRALVRTGEIEVIFLEGPLQRRLYQAALWEGATPDQLREIIAWPNRKGHEGALVRHSRGHDGHIHVRFRCGPDEPRCRPRRRDPEATWLASAPHSPDPPIKNAITGICATPCAPTEAGSSSASHALRRRPYPCTPPGAPDPLDPPGHGGQEHPSPKGPQAS